MMASRARLFVGRRLRSRADGCASREAAAHSGNERQYWRVARASTAHVWHLQQGKKIPQRMQRSINTVARFPQVGVAPQGGNLEELDELSQRLYEYMFEPFGVSVEQFQLLTRIAARHKLQVGDVVVRGGSPNRKVFLLIRGWAIAYQHEPGNAELGPPVCQYIGKLETKQQGQHKQLVDGVVLPTRASVIAGSALCDGRLADANCRKLYPHSVVAGTGVELLEWDIMLLQRFINRPKYRAVQASLYYSLYVDLIGTLDRARAIEMINSGPVAPANKSVSAVKEESIAAPTSSQLLSLFIFISVPFVGFGFADNVIMIVCGDYIDATVGIRLGFTTLAAAGIGNWMSDLAGLGLGDAIERAAGKMGLTNGGLTQAQEGLKSARMTSLAGKMIGITIGCFLGMFPLLFLNHPKKEFTVEELALYNNAFVSHGVTTVQFESLLEKGTRKGVSAETHLVEGRKPFTKIILLLSGHLNGYRPSDASPDAPRKPDCRWSGRMQVDDRPGVKTVPFRGSVIGGQALADNNLTEKVYPYDIIATTSVDYIEWDLKDICILTNETPALQASFFSMLYQDIVKNKTSKQLEIYQSILQAVLADGVVNSQEYALVVSARAKFNVSEEEHFNLLAELGWSRQRWEQRCATQSTNDQQILLENVAEIEKSLAKMKVALSSE